MYKKIILIISMFISLYGKSFENTYVTHGELEIILKNLLNSVTIQQEIKAKYKEKVYKEELFKNVLEKSSSHNIIKKMIYLNKRKNYKEVGYRCEFLLNDNKKEIKESKKADVLFMCSNVDIVNEKYNMALNKYQKLLYINDKNINNKLVMGKMLEIYKIQKNEEKIKEIKDILSD